MRREFSRREFLLMGFVTPRGLSAAAMAPIVAMAIASLGDVVLASRVINIIFLVIMLSVLFSSAAALILGRGLRNGEGKNEHPKHSVVHEHQTQPEAEHVRPAF
jgi:NhaP-type Na+/H+ or K+/H+ antiporter